MPETISFKRCPVCSTQTSVGSAVCPRCGHAYGSPAPTARAGPTVRCCIPHCARTIPANSPSCPYCGAYQQHSPYGSPGYNPFAAAQAYANVQPRARGGLIALMWGLTAVGIASLALRTATVFDLCEIAALVTAIVLVCGPALADKVNGWIRIGCCALELVAIVVTIAFVGSMVSAMFRQHGAGPPPSAPFYPRDVTGSPFGGR